MLNQLIKLNKPFSLSQNKNFFKNKANIGDIGLEIIEEVTSIEEYEDKKKMDRVLTDISNSEADSDSSRHDHMAEYKFKKTLKKYAS